MSCVPGTRLRRVTTTLTAPAVGTTRMVIDMSSSQKHRIHLGAEHSIGLQSDDVWDRYRSMRSDAQDRMDAKELTNIQFVELLLDVYALHLEDSP